MQALHRIREQLKAQRTATINLLRGVLREFGIVIPVGAAKVRPAVLSALEDGENELPIALRHALSEMLNRLADLTHGMKRSSSSWKTMRTPIRSASATNRRRASVYSRPRRYAPVAGRSIGFPVDDTSQPGSAWRHASIPPETTATLGASANVAMATCACADSWSARDTARGRMREQQQQPLNRLQTWALALQQRVGHNKAAVALANKLRDGYGQWNITTLPSTPITSACVPLNHNPRVALVIKLMANVSVPNRIKPITLLAHEAALNDWLSIRGFHDGPSQKRSPQGRIHDCNRLHSPVRRAPGKSATCMRSPYTNS